MLRIDGAGGVKVAVGFLGGGKPGNERIEVGRHFRVGLDRQGIGSAFKNLVRIGVVERISRRLAVGDILAVKDGRGPVKIVHAAGGFALSKGIGNRDGPVGFEARRPKSVIEMDIGKGHTSDGIIPWGGAGCPQRQTGNN